MDKKTTGIIAYLTWIGFLVAILAGDKEGAKFHINQALVAILDADKEGFLRSERSLIQTIGRAARNTDGTVIMYADELTESMEKAIHETNRRRKIQEEYNKKHGIVPKSIIKDVRDSVKAVFTADEAPKIEIDKEETLEQTIDRLTEEMFVYARSYEFEKAAIIRDLINELKGAG